MYNSAADKFNQQKPPTGYIAGIGRGAVGFTTRSDVGPARSSTGLGLSFDAPPIGYVAGRGRGMGDLARSQGELTGKYANDDDRADYSESNYDSFSGYSSALFNDVPYDQEDELADKAYGNVDQILAMRSKRKRQDLNESQKRSKNEKPTISEQFSDLKRDLSSMTRADWETIPEVGEFSMQSNFQHKQQRQRQELFTPVPDSIIQDNHERSLIMSSLDNRDSTISGADTSIIGLAGARGQVLEMKLDRISDSISGQTVVDPQGYLTSLSSIRVTSDSEIGDIDKARLLLKSVTTTNPTHAPGWIAAARIEEYAGKPLQAKKLIRKGCDSCCLNEDVWLEAARIFPPDQGKLILADAVGHLPQSVKIWLKACELESLPDRKKIVLRRALELVSTSVKLWKALIELEDDDNARVLLSRAVECVPHSVDLWLGLARLETYDGARIVLNQARDALPTEPLIWINAAKLEEVHGHIDSVDRIISKTIKSLQEHSVAIDRGYWIKEAEAAEAQYPICCASMIRNTISIGIDECDYHKTWMIDVDSSLSRQCVQTARSILDYALTIFPDKKDIWLRACDLEKRFGSAASLQSILVRGTNNCPQTEVLWLMAAREKYAANDVSGARVVLQEAFGANPNSESIWLAAAKLELDNRQFDRARDLLSRARNNSPSARVWMKSAQHERICGNFQIALNLINEGIGKYPDFPKFYMMGGQVCDESLDDCVTALQYYQSGIDLCPTNVPLRLLLSEFQEKRKGPSYGRVCLETARQFIPFNDVLWFACYNLERRCGQASQAESCLVRGLQECPKSGILWAEFLLTAPKHMRKSRSAEALKNCDNDAHVIMAVAQLFERDDKISQARKWYERASLLDKDLGDVWGRWLAFEMRHGNEQDRASVISKAVQEDPKHGVIWTLISKKLENREALCEKILRLVADFVLRSNS